MDGLETRQKGDFTKLPTRVDMAKIISPEYFAVEREKVAALAHRPHDVHHLARGARHHGVDAVEGLVVRGAQQLRHAGVGDHILLAAAPLPVQDARQQHARPGHQEPPRLHDQLESGDVGAATAAITAHLDTTLKVLLSG